MIKGNDVEFLRGILTFWDKLSLDQKDFIIDNASIVNYKKGTNVHGSDNKCLGVLLIKSGCLRTYMLSEEGKEITLYRLYDNDVCILSASCLISNITFDVHIDAEKDSEIILISSSAFVELISKNVYVENFSYKCTVDRFSDVMWAMEQILFMSFDKRVAVFLLDEAVREQSDTIKLTHEQIAKYIGSAREVVSRMLKYFAAEGLVKLSRGGITLLDKNGIKKLL